MNIPLLYHGSKHYMTCSVDILLLAAKATAVTFEMVQSMMLHAIDKHCLICTMA